MTKKDYVAIAAVLAGYVYTDPRDYQSLVFRMADMLARDNPRFNRDRFLAACAAKVKE